MRQKVSESETLIKQWNYKKNISLDPEKLTQGSKKKVWWVCDKEHEWEAVIFNRSRGVSNCPYCSNRKVGYGNDLASTNPQLIKELHPTKNHIDPSLVTYGTKTKLYWQCPNRHYWKATPHERIRGRGCPYCLNRKLGQGNDLQTKYPNLAAEWHTRLNGFPASEQVSGTFFQAWWECSICGYKWQRDVKGRVDGAGCPVCKQTQARETRNQNKIILVGSLKDNYPILVKEWHPTKNKLGPHKYLSGSDKVVWWLCPRGHDYPMAIKDRTKKNAFGCPKCSGNTSKVEIRTLSELMFIFEQLDWREKIKGHEADIFSKEFGFVVEVDGYPWHMGKEKRDKKKTEHFESLGLVVFRLRDRRLLSIGNNEITFRSDIFSDDLFHESIKQLVQVIIGTINNFPAYVRHRSKEYLDSKVYCGEESYQEYLKYYRGPPPGKSLKNRFPEIASEWSNRNNLDPSQVSSGSGEKYWFVCPEGHEYNQRVISRTSQKAKCPICANRRVLKGFNDLESNYPDISKEWSKNNRYSPSEIVYSSNKKALWVCEKCGKEYESAISNRTQRNTACSSCSKKKAWERRRLNKGV